MQKKQGSGGAGFTLILIVLFSSGRSGAQLWFGTRGTLTTGWPPGDIAAPQMQVPTHPEHEAQVLAALISKSKASFQGLAGLIRQ